MALLQKEKNTAAPTSRETAENANLVSPEMEGQDEQLWASAITNSLDVIREMADKARAERRAGRTKKITL